MCVTLAFSSFCLKLTICTKINLSHQDTKCIALHSTAKNHVSFSPDNSLQRGKLGYAINARFYWEERSLPMWENVI